LLLLPGVIQTFLLNGPSTNDSDCSISFQNCWSWGLSINAYYGVLFGVILLLTIPIFWLKELDATNIPQVHLPLWRTPLLHLLFPPD
jgi:hypothetical protein